MVRNYLGVAASESRSMAEAESTHGFGERVFSKLWEGCCGLHGHDNVLQFERDRMFVRCLSCGHESPGWKIHESMPAPVERPGLVTPHLVRARRMA